MLLRKIFEHARKILLSRKGSPTIEYVVVMLAAIALALLLNQVVASAEIQELLKEKIQQAINGQMVDSPSDTVASSSNEKESSNSSSQKPQSLSERNQELFGQIELFDTIKKSAKNIWNGVTDAASKAWSEAQDNLHQSILEGIKKNGAKQEFIKQALMLFDPLNLPNKLIQAATGYDLLGSVYDYVSEHPAETAVAAGLILLSIFQPEIGVAGLISGTASGSMVAGGASGIFGWAVFRTVGTWIARSRFGAWLAETASPFVQRLVTNSLSGGAAAFTDSVVFDWLKGKMPSIKKAVVSGLIGLGVVLGGGAIAEKAPTIISKINQLPVSPVTVFEDGSASAPKTIGDTEFGRWLQKFASNRASGSKKVTRDDLIPGSAEHKEQRWKEYLENGGKMDYDHWSKLYDANMGKPGKSHQIVEAYKNKLNWEGSTQVAVNTPYGRRLLDIANTDLRKAIEHKTTTKEDIKGYFSLNERIREEIAKDEYLVSRGWDITWVFENAGASEPLKQELKRSGIKVKFENTRSNK
ncbi:DUF4244 domain-containing protein [Lihuaxuella thermophila]|uniref:Uncharacterized protein n=1 Tax=Lihuaxuella thermophila TaxID=1173111 RepID=A0A1H8BT73_9BACL|nr:DUF4244 domain-containing protein [Lihuaxuella thermophila]SEM85344.1 Protein of unknown function [Lihuaxuella thermophila]